MKLLFVLLTVVALTSPNAISQTRSIESQILDEMRISFKENGLNMYQLVDMYEEKLMEKELLKDSTSDGWEQLIYVKSGEGIIGHFTPKDLGVVALEFQLSLQHLANAVKVVQSRDSAAYVNSDVHRFISRYPQPKRNADPSLVYLVKTINGADEGLRQHPLFKQLLVMIAANFTNLIDRSNDKVLQTESDYARWYRAMGGNIPKFQQRNIAEIKVNALGQMMVRGKMMDTLTDAKPILRDFCTINRKLPRNQIEKYLKDENYEGYNYPFFSIITDKEINTQINRINAQLDTLKSRENNYKGLIWMRELWLHKKHHLKTCRSAELRERDINSHFAVTTSNRYDTENINKALVPILEVVSELRNAEAQYVFGESFDEISKRNNFLLNDHYKLRYLENQFPLLVLVNPGAYVNQGAKPPVQMNKED